jgi:hypothetical protein
VGDFVDAYDQLVVNARMVAHMPSALASFLLHRAKNKPYLIDPETHAFQQDIEFLTSPSESGGIKRSVRALAKAYGPPITTRLLEQQAPVLPKDFDDPSILRDFCRRVLDFQRDRIRTEANDSDAAKYYRFHTSTDTKAAFGPALLVAPYFHLTATTYKAWLPVNLKLAQASREIAREYRCPLAVQMVIGSELLTDLPSRDTIANQYRDVSAEAFLLWVDRFHEDRASLGALNSLTTLIATLGAKAPVVNLYGGFFSVVLSRTQLAPLAAVTHGLEYGEGRSVIPVGGGVPVSKFYVPAVHARLVFREAYRAVGRLNGLSSAEAFFKYVCDCSECRTVIDTDPNKAFLRYGLTKTLPPTETRRRAMEFPTQETKNHCVRHYMFVKEREYRSTEPIQDTIASLKATHTLLDGVLSPEAIAHCGVWAEQLSAQISD